MTFGLSAIRQTARALAQQPGNSLLIVTVLALGLAGVIAMLSIIKSMVWDPLPFPNAENVVALGWRDLDNDAASVQSMRGDQYLRLRERTAGSWQLAGSSSATVNLQVAQGVERFDGAFITDNLFPMLGVEPLLGRGLTSDDNQPGAPLVALLAEEIWRTRFASDPEILGREVRVNAQPATVVGIMPARFSFPGREQVWVPLQIDTAEAGKTRDVSAFADGATGLPELTGKLEAWLGHERKLDPRYFADQQIEAFTLPMALLFSDSETRQILYLMLVTVALVLIVACANAANLMLARSLASSRDYALRLTLGASRSNLVTQLLAQSLGLAAIALLIAVPLAQFGIDAVMRGFSGTDDGPPPWMVFSIDAEMVLVATIVAALTALIVALLPILRLDVGALGAVMRDGGRSVAGSASGKLSRFLVVGEIALACVVLLTTLIVVRGVDNLARTDLGIKPDGLLTARIALFADAYPQDADTVRFFEQLVERLRLEPGVESAGAGTTLPGLMASTERVMPEGHDADGQSAPSVRYAPVDAGFIPTYGIGMLAGRGFDERDSATSERVVIVDQRFADMFFASGDALGRRVRIPSEGPEAQWHTVVGVVQSLHLDDAGDQLMANALVPLAQHPARFVSVVTRVRGNAESFKPRFLEIVRSQDPDSPAYWLRTYEEVLRTAMAGEHVLSGMFSAFGVLALVLIVAGLYGLIAQLVGQRVREIGVQRALGASSVSVLQGLFGRLSVQVAIGLLIGIGLALPFGEQISKALPGLHVQVEAVTVAALVMILVGVCVLATLFPAMRALAVDPTVALRHE